jgi:hypothetical protein
MEVIATKQGFDGICLREPGEQFTMPDGVKGSWFYPVGDSVGASRRGKKGAAAPPSKPEDDGAGGEA